MDQVCLNGKFYAASQPLIAVRSPGFTWGEGFFETIKVRKGKILLEELHYKRAKHAAQMLDLQPEILRHESELSKYILQLCEYNNCMEAARVRVSFFRMEGDVPGWCIDARGLSEDFFRWNEKGFRVGVFPHARKSPDVISNLKTANFLVYTLAARHARKEGWDDAIVLNTDQRIADTSRANIFIVRDGVVLTPQLSEGCVSGVMREFLMDAMKKEGIDVKEQSLSEEDLLTADEMFLTNCIQDVRWVRHYGQRKFDNKVSRNLYERLVRSGNF